MYTVLTHIHTHTQRLHNVHVVLKALEGCVKLPAGVTSESIVEGHREKTLALLWSIIFEFKVQCSQRCPDVSTAG